MNNSIQNTPAFVNAEIAIYRGMVNEAISFIDALSDKNEIDRFGETLLFKSARAHKPVIAEYLLSTGADPDISEYSGLPLLHYVVQSSDISMIELFCNSGANINILDKYGNNALDKALFSHSRWSQHIVAYLIDMGVDPDHNNHYGKSARDTANIIANYDFAPLFCKKHSDIVIANKKIIGGESVNYVYRFAIDGIYEFQAEENPKLQDMVILSTNEINSICGEYLISVAKMLQPNQYAFNSHSNSGRWQIGQIDIGECYIHY